MLDFLHDYSTCRNVLLDRLREPAPGRIQLLTGPRQVGMTTLLLEIAAEFGAAALNAVLFGSCPGVVVLQNDLHRWSVCVRDSIIEPAIGRDVLALGAARRPGLLRQVFAITVASPAQLVSLQKLQKQLQDKGAFETGRIIWPFFRMCIW